MVLTAVPPTPTPYEWLTLELTNVQTDETFTLADFAGKTVVIEMMAVWCPLCKRQQTQLKVALEEFADDEVVAVCIDVDPRETADLLRQYARDHEFTWYYANSSLALATSFESTFGPQILSPTSTPILIISPDGRATLSPYGIKDADTLIELIKAGEDS